MSASTNAWTLRARLVFPVEGAPIENGVVTVQDDRILGVGSASGDRPDYDLGDVAVLPGLVNTHTHLEFSQLEAPLGDPGMRFADWIERVVAWRRESRDADAPPDALPGMGPASRRGLDESRLAGVVAVGETATNEWADDDGREFGARCLVFRELLGLAPDQLDRLLEVARTHVDQGRRAVWRPGLSPHAPYTVHPDLLSRLVQLSVERDVPLSMHLAETLEEVELLGSHSGPLVERLAALDAWHPQVLPRGIGPGDYLDQLSHAARALVVHGNYLTAKEWDLLGQCRDRMSVAYCPRTHSYFGHGRYPLAEMLAAGVRVTLGTDSRASNPDLDLFHEAQFVANRHASVAPADVLKMATLWGAEALGLDDSLGSLAPGKRADFMVVKLRGAKATDPHELLWTADDANRERLEAGQRPSARDLEA